MSRSRLGGVLAIICLLGAITAILVGLHAPHWALVSWAFLITGFLIGMAIGPNEGGK